MAEDVVRDEDGGVAQLLLRLDGALHAVQAAMLPMHLLGINNLAQLVRDDDGDHEDLNEAYSDEGERNLEGVLVTEHLLRQLERASTMIEHVVEHLPNKKGVVRGG